MTVRSQVEYLAGRSKRPVYKASTAGRDAKHDIDQPMNIVSVEVNNARNLDSADELREHGMHPAGFDLLKHQTQVENFLDQDQIKSAYVVEIEALLKSITGCYRVHIFDHTLRASDPGLREINNVREPAYLVHNDYTSNSGYVCLRENLGDEAEELAKDRFQIVNVWRPLVDPVENLPLALCDSRSLKAEDLVDTERRAANHTGEIQLAIYNPAHRWFYYPQMNSEEVLLFKTFDSIDGGINPCSIHSAIELPDAPADAKPRESVEVRAFVFYR